MHLLGAVSDAFMCQHLAHLPVTLDIQLARNTLNNNFWEYLTRTDASKQSIEKNQRLGVMGNSRVDKDNYVGLRDSVRSQKLSDAMFDKGLCEHGDDEAAPHLMCLLQLAHVFAHVGTP